MSAPCKGFSGLLSSERSLSNKYQALNQLALRSVWLVLEAYKDDPPEFLLFENVPRIATRGRHLLEQIKSLLNNFGYASAPTTHCCGRLGGLAQKRHRFLLIARHIEKVPPFLYEPRQRPLRAVGDVLGKMMLPGDPAGGPMHKIPQLHWRTWVRLAFVEAGKDWRSLQRLQVEDGFLKDFAIARDERWFNDTLGVRSWDEPSHTITGDARPSKGAFSVADPRYEAEEYESSQFGVTDWKESANTITGQRSPGQGKYSVADPRIDGHEKSVQMGVRKWDQPAATVTASMWAGTGPNSVADPRVDGIRHNNVFRVVRWDETSPAVTGGTGPTAGGLAVSDPRTSYGPNSHRNKLAVTPWERAANTVTGATQVQGGGLSVADPRPANGWEGGGKYRVSQFDEPAGTVIAESHTGNGAFAVADPRPGLDRGHGDDFLTAGHYGVVHWNQPSGAVTANMGHDNGRGNVADPRLPLPTDRLVAVIRAYDGTWHRPFTTLELAALQSLYDPEEDAGIFTLEGTSDSAWREHIGNAVPPATAQAIADVIGHTLLLAWSGETFALGSTPIWVRPIAIALSVKQELPQ
jgi:site-specific DNA-cytosine methylase